jgi:bifunctional UDP-N-acetylglucosamine pyrophosphorylase/glucosamine-1-phosphate N-acetyltransferase
MLMSELHVIILAAGQGTRMRSALPKVLHRVAGRPMLAHVIDTARRLGPVAVHVVHGHGGASVREAVDGAGLVWVEQREQLGTGHAVEQAMPGVPDSARVLVLCGDVPLIRAETLEDVMLAAGADALGLVSVVLEDPAGYGRVVRAANGGVTGIVEHRDASPEQLEIAECNTGIVASGAGRLRRWLSALERDNAQGEFYLTDVIGMAAADGVAVTAVAAADAHEVLGVNDRAQLAEAERAYQRREAARLMRDGASLADPARVDVRGLVTVGRDVWLDVNVVLEGEVTLGDGARIGPNVVLKDCLVASGAEVLAHSVVEGAEIGTGARVGPYARLRPGTRLGEGVHVGNFVETKNTTLGRGSKANHLTYLGDTDVGSDVNVGAGTITCNYDGAAKHRTVIGDRAFIGSGVELVAPVTVHPDATIGAGSTISRDAPEGQLTLSRVRQTTVHRWIRPSKKPEGD